MLPHVSHVFKSCSPRSAPVHRNYWLQQIKVQFIATFIDINFYVTVTTATTLYNHIICIWCIFHYISVLLLVNFCYALLWVRTFTVAFFEFAMWYLMILSREASQTLLLLHILTTNMVGFPIYGLIWCSQWVAQRVSQWFTARKSRPSLNPFKKPPLRFVWKWGLLQDCPTSYVHIRFPYDSIAIEKYKQNGILSAFADKVLQKFRHRRSYVSIWTSEYR